MAVSARYEIKIDAHDPETDSGSSFLHRAYSGSEVATEKHARDEFERVKRAMQGHDENLYADHYVTVRLLKGEPGAQTEIDRYNRGA